jgi:hypothetical protein
MCNLYSITTNEAAIAELLRVAKRYVRNFRLYSWRNAETQLLVSACKSATAFDRELRDQHLLSCLEFGFEL